MRAPKAFAVSLAALVLVAGCLGADERGDPAPPDPPGHFVPSGNLTDGLPPYRDLPPTVSKLSVVAFGDAPGGVRLQVWNDRAYVATGVSSESIAIFDISDPYQPERLGAIASDVGAREGVDVLHYGDRTVVVASQASPVAGPIVFWDVTDPEEPVELARFPVESHIVAVHRAAHVVYNADFATGTPGAVQIFDASDPDDIRLARTWSWGVVAADGMPIQPGGCHDIFVRADLDRAYCAAPVQTQVWDVSDPFNPVVLTTVTNPAMSHHNTAFPILDGSVLAIGDETGGCGDIDDVKGSLWFYDLTVTPAQLLGRVKPLGAGGTSGCAPHFGSEMGPGTGLIVFGWFGAGLVLVDASDPTNPVVVDQNDEGGSGSDAKYYRGLVFGAGSGGGLRVAVPE